MGIDYDMSLNEWCSYFSFVNNNGHVCCSHNMLNPECLCTYS
jgi:hypothetical protein